MFAPSCRFTEETELNFIHALLKTSDILSGSKDSVVKVVLVDTVGDEDMVVWIVLINELSSHIERSVIGDLMSKIVIIVTKPAICVLHEELEGNALIWRSRAAKFALAVTRGIEEHEVDEVWNIDIVCGVGEWLRTCSSRLSLGPLITVTVINREIFDEVVVRIDGLVFIIIASKIFRQHRSIPTLAEVILPPIGAVYVNVNKTTMRSDITHIE